MTQFPYRNCGKHWKKTRGDQHNSYQGHGNLYKNAKPKIKIGKFVSEEIKVEKGLRQGCGISPTLFEIFIHTALLNRNRKCSDMGVPVGDESQDTIYTLICGWPGVNNTRIWRHGVHGQKVIGTIRKVGFENIFRKNFLRGFVEQKPKI